MSPQTISICKLAVAFLVLLFSAGQSSDRQTLLQRAEQLKAQMQADRAAALESAVRYNWPVRTALDDGRVIELQGLSYGKPVYYITHNLQAAATLATDKIWPSGQLGYSLTGQSRTLAMWDGGAVRASHKEFGGRAGQQDSGAEIEHHATHVAGTLIAAGVDKNARGMAYRGTLRAYDWNNDLAEMTAAAADNIYLSNHSYGPTAGWMYNFFKDNRWAWFGDASISETEDYKFGYYLERARQWDDLIHQNPSYVIVVSAGNDRSETGPYHPTDEYWILQGSEWVLSTIQRDPDGGADGYDSINGFAVAKNLITVGAVQALPWPYSSPADVRMTNFSCFGPTDDGRIKPDITADGVYIYSTLSAANDHYGMLSGTSQATPSVTGSIALLKEHFRNLHGNKTLLASTLKALIVHTAREAGAAPGPDYQFGWGLMNTTAAVALITEDFEGGGNFFIRQQSLTNGGQLEFQIESDGMQPLKATLCWTDPAGPVIPPALDPSTPALVNDLDMRIIGPAASADSRTWYPWALDPAVPSQAAGSGDNRRDNVEQIDIPAPQAGTYVLRITHKNALQGGSQAASVILSGNIGKSIAIPAQVILTSPAESAIINADSVRLFWQTAARASHYTLQIAADENFNSLLIHQDNIRGTHYTLYDAPANTRMYWRVFARNAAGQGVSSSPRSFTVGEEGAIMVWQKLTPNDLNYQVTALIVNNKGHILASLIPLPSLPNYSDIVGTYRSKDDGATWERINFDFTKYKLDQSGSIWGISSILFNLGEDGDHRQEIFCQPELTVKDIYIDGDAFYLLCYYGEFYFSQDRGKSWREMEKIPLQSYSHGQSLNMIDGKLFVATWGEGAFCSADSGKSWTNITTAANIYYVYCIRAALDGRLLMGTAQGFYTSPADTIHWQRKISGGIEISKSTDIIVGDHGDVYSNSYGCQGPGDGVFVSLDHGETWTTVTQGLHMNSTHAIYKVPGGDVYVGTGTGNPNDGGAVYFGSQQTAVQAAARKLGVTTPGQVTLTTPGQNDVHNLLDITLQWQTVPYGAMYRVQLAADAGFTQVLCDEKTAFAGIRIVNLSKATTYYWRVRASNALGEGAWSDPRKFSTSEWAAVQENMNLPVDFKLEQNYPNPFNAATTIEFTLAQKSGVSLKIYDLLGREIAALIGEDRDTGRHTVRLDAGALPAGLYLYRLEAAGLSACRKMILIR